MAVRQLSSAVLRYAAASWPALPSLESESSVKGSRQNRGQSLSSCGSGLQLQRLRLAEPWNPAHGIGPHTLLGTQTRFL